MTFRCDQIRAETTSEIKTQLKAVLTSSYADLFPSDRTSSILLKPNLNANMNALTGNTTDLRLLAAVIEFLKDAGYTDITIGEGTNSGYYRNRISVISRLMVDSLAIRYGISVKDLNYSEPVSINFENGVQAAVARECVEADLLVNLPKLKTHFEAGMSVCLKNLMGCLVGQENKKKTHQSLAANILNINKHVKPKLHIVDALISMEGLGPTRGTPVRTGTVFVGTDPYLLDLVCARFAGFPYQKVRTLAEAEKQGLIDSRYHAFAESIQFTTRHAFKPPKAGPLATFIHSPKRQKYFLAVRNTPFFNYVCSTKIGGALLYKTGLRQDVFIDDEMKCECLRIDPARCTKCGICAGYCPVDIQLPEETPDEKHGCIGCLYCFFVCPEKAVEFHGNFGFISEQLRQYDTIIRKMVRKS